MLRIVLLTGPDPQHRYLANRLSRELPLVAIVVDHGRRVSTVLKLQRIWSRYSFAEIIGRICLLILRWVAADNKRKRTSQTRVFGDDGAAFHRIDLLRHVSGINSRESVRTIAEQRPDLLLVFGTGIVGSEVLSLANHLALNLHTGISPYYRGSDCAFWPIHNEEPGMLGATVHECTSQLDGGSILAIARPQLSADDCIFTVFARCVVAGTEIYARAVRDVLNGTDERQTQDLTKGREYRAADRGLFAELRARRVLRAALIQRYVRSLQSHTSVEH